MTTITTAHLSDTHLGYRDYEARAPSGHNQREVDMVAALRRCVDRILTVDHDLVVHAGDVFDRPTVPTRLMLEVQNQLHRLTEPRADGTRRQVVIVAGNHELPYALKDACVLDLYRTIPGVHVVTRGYQRVDLSRVGVDAPPSLDDVVVHAIPHDDLDPRRTDWRDVAPVEGKVNVLTTHGVAQGSELYMRALGREHPIPTEVLTRDWHYVALGHYHVRGKVLPRVWYSGSPEHVSARDLRDDQPTRGFLTVDIPVDGSEPEPRPEDIEVRPMVRLPAVDAADLDADGLAAQLRAHIDAAHIDGAVVLQRVEGVRRETLALLDRSALRQHAAAALHYEIIPVRAAAADEQDGEDRRRAQASGGLADAGEVLDEEAAELVPAARRPAAVELAKRLLAREIAGTTKRRVDQTEQHREQLLPGDLAAAAARGDPEDVEPDHDPDAPSHDDADASASGDAVAEAPAGDDAGGSGDGPSADRRADEREEVAR